MIRFGGDADEGGGRLRRRRRAAGRRRHRRLRVVVRDPPASRQHRPARVRPLAQAAQHKVHRVLPDAGCTAKPVGVVTRGTTNPNRLRRVDNWIAAALRGRAAPTRPIRSSSTSATARRRSPRSSCGTRLAKRARRRAGRRPGDRSGTGRRCPAAAGPPGLTFARGGFELAGLRPVVVRAFNVLRQYDEAAVARRLGDDDGRAGPGRRRSSRVRATNSAGSRPGSTLDRRRPADAHTRGAACPLWTVRRRWPSGCPRR